MTENRETRSLGRHNTSPDERIGTVIQTSQTQLTKPSNQSNLQQQCVLHHELQHTPVQGPSSRNNSSYTCHTTAYNMSTSHDSVINAIVDNFTDPSIGKCGQPSSWKTCSFSDVHNCRGRLMTRQCLKHAFSKTRIVHWLTQRQCEHPSGYHTR